MMKCSSRTLILTFVMLMLVPLFTSAAPSQYYDYNLTDLNCTVEISVTAHSGNMSVHGNSVPFQCSETKLGYDTLFVNTFETQTLTLTSLNAGMYSAAIEGIGSYTIEHSSHCAIDITPPSVVMTSPYYVKGSETLEAHVADMNDPINQTSCEVCVSSDGTCDTEWTSQNVSFVEGEDDKTGTCVYNWDSNEILLGSFEVQMRARDVSSNLGVSRGQNVIVDNEAPTIETIDTPEVTTSDNEFTLFVTATDGVEIGDVFADIRSKDVSVTYYLSSSGENVFSAQVNPLPAGDYSINMTVNDLANNSVTQSVALRVNEPLGMSDAIRMTYDDSSSHDPVIVETPNGKVHQFWSDNAGGSFDITRTTYSLQALQPYHEPIQPHNESSSLFPSATTDTSGNIHLVWQDDRDGNNEIYYVKLDQDGNNLIPLRRITTNTFSSERPQVVAFVNMIYILFLDDRSGSSALYATVMDDQGNVAVNTTMVGDDAVEFVADKDRVAYRSSQDELRISFIGPSMPYSVVGTNVNSFSLVAQPDQTYVLWQNNDQELLMATALGDTIEGQASLGYLDSPSELAFTQDSSGKFHVVFVEGGSQEIHYLRLDSDFDELVKPITLSNEFKAQHPFVVSVPQGAEVPEGAPVSTPGDDTIHIAWEDPELGEVVHITSTELDSNPPILSAVSIKSALAYSVSLEFTTHERARSTIYYGKEGATDLLLENESMRKTHTFMLRDLEPATEYTFYVTATDLFGNTARHPFGEGTQSVWTRNTTSRPALPTTVYGKVLFQNGSVAPDVEVKATWVDTDDNTHITKVDTMTESDAIGIGNTSLKGYYLFNLGQLKAKTSSPITLSAPGMTQAAPSVIAFPGGDPQAASDIVIDTIPPHITIQSPTPQLYDTPYVTLQFTLDETVSQAHYTLNGGLPIDVTNRVGDSISVTANEGNNSIVVSAQDLVGLTSQEEVTFVVQDAIAPSFDFNPPNALHSDTLLSASVNDPTSSLQAGSCQVCDVSDGVCAGQWTAAVSNFGSGDMQGSCDYLFDVTERIDGSYYVAFKVTDVNGNVGETGLHEIYVDRDAPDDITGLVVSANPPHAELQLQWDQSLASDFSHYHIYRSEVPFASVKDAGVVHIATLEGIGQTAYTDSQGLESDTTYHYAVTALDVASNENINVASTSGTVPDVVGPQLTIVTPEETRYGSLSIDVSFTSDEDTYNCQYQVNGGQWTTGVSSPFSIGVEEGENTLLLQCEDEYANSGDAQRSFEVDVTAPQPVSGLYVHATKGETLLTLGWDQHDATDFASYNVYRALEEFSDVSAAQLITTVEVREETSFVDTGLESFETYYYAITAIDTLGNENPSVTSRFGTVAETTPPGAISGLSVATVEGQMRLDVAWDASDADDLSHYNIYRSAESFDSTSALSPITQTTQLSYIDTVVANGETYYYAVAGVDFAGNENTTVSSVMGVVDDILPPVISVSSPQEQYYSNADIDLLFAVNEDSSCTYVLNGESTVSATPDVLQNLNVAEGENVLVLTCTDAESNEAQVQVTFGLDTGIPDPITGLNVNHVPGEKELSVSWDVSQSADFDHYTIYRAPVPFTHAHNAAPLVELNDVSDPYYVDSNLESETTYYYAVTQSDAAGNENTTVNAVPGTIPDLDPPTVSIASPIDGTLYEQTLVELSYSALDAQYCSYSVNGGSDIALNGTIDVNFPEGDVELVVACSDESNNVGTDTVSFTVDTIPPEPVTGLMVTTVPQHNTLTLSWDVHTEQNFVAYELYRSTIGFSDVNNAYFIGQVGSQYETSFNDTNLESGATYHYAVVATDAAQNKNPNVVSVAGTVADTIAPERIQGLTLTPSQGVVGLDLTWEESADPDFFVYRIYRRQSPFVYIENAEMIGEVYNRNVPQFSDYTVQSEQEYYYAVTALDTSLNEDSSVTSVMGIPPDVNPPLIIIVTPESETYTSHDHLLSVTVSESASCSFTLNNATAVDMSGLEAPFTAVEGSNTLVVSCTDESGNQGSTQVTFEVDSVPPTEVSGTTAVFDNESVIVTWNAAVDAVSYSVYRSEESFETTEGLTPLATTAQTYYSDSSVASDTTYYYGVSPTDVHGNINTNMNGASVATPDFTPPAQVTGLTIVNVPNEYSLDLSWDASSDSDTVSYTVFRSLNPFVNTASATPLATLNGIDQTSLRDEGLGSFETYHYAVVATDADGNVNTNVVSVMGETGETVAPEITVITPVQSNLYNNPVRLHWRLDEEPQQCSYVLNDGEPENLPLVKIECKKYLGGYDYINNDADPYDDHGHGTHCAGIAAGNGGNIVGVAPDAHLTAYKVLSASGSGSWSSVISGIDRAVADGADVMSLSLGGYGNPDDPASIALDNAVNAGVVAVVAAGNSGPGSGTIGSPGTSRNAITVGAIDKSFNIAYFSSRGPTSAGPKPDIIAPGVSIYSATPGNGYASWSGTSMATPHVAGVAALMLQQNPEWDPFVVKNTMMGNAIDLGYDINTQGAGSIDVMQILNGAGQGSQTPSGTPLSSPDNSDSAGAPTFGDSSFIPSGVAYAPDQKRKIIVQLDEDSVTEKIAQAPMGTPEGSLDAIRGQQLSKVARAQQGISQELSTMGLPVEESYQSALNGLVLEATEAEIEEIQKIPGVKRIFEDREIRVALDDSVPLINADDAWEMLDAIGRPLTGKGITIAIIDTGIDYNHPAFASADCGWEYETAFTAQEGGNTIQLSCTDLYDNVGYSDEISFSIDETAPSQVEGLAVTPLAGMAALQLDWQQAPEDDISHYHVYRSASAFTNVDGLVPVETLFGVHSSYTDSTALISEATYYYAITAVDLAGNEHQDVVSVAGTVVDLTPPSPVTGLTVDTMINEQKLSLTWNSHSASDLAGFTIYRSDAPFTDSTSAGVSVVTQVNGDTLTYVDEGLTIGAQYHYAVAAYDEDGNENPSVDSEAGIVDDLIGPEITIDTPEEGSLFATSNIALQWEVSEQPSSCEYTLNGGEPQPLVLNQVPCEKYLGGYDFVNNDNDPWDGHGHGTHCAGIAAGNGGNIVGVAPDAQLRAYKVLADSGWGYWSWVIAGIEAAVEDGADIMSLSLGGSGHPDDIVSTAVDNAVNAGIVAVIAAGNSGPGSGTIGSPGTARNAITVGAVNKALQIAGFSSRGPTSAGVKPDVVAPGVSIYSALPNNNYASWSGTSMATPHVAGAAALMLQADPELNPFDIKDAMKTNAIDLGYGDNTQGEGFNDILAVMQQSANGSSGGLGISSDEATHTPEVDSSSFAPDEVRRVLVVLEEPSITEMQASGSINAQAQDDRISFMQNQMVGSLNDIGVQTSMQFSYVINALVVLANEAQMDAIRAMDEVVDVLEDEKVYLNLDDSVPLVNADDVWEMTDSSGLPITGKNVVIAIIDTGIDENHPAFASSNSQCDFTYTQQLVVPDGEHEMRVTCSDIAGHVGTSAPRYFTVDTTAPDAISGLSVATVPGVHSLDLSWDASDADDFFEYRIYRSLQPFSSSTSASQVAVIDVQSQTTFTDTALAGGQMYYYAITAVDQFGNERTDVSAVSGTVADIEPPTISITEPYYNWDFIYDSSEVPLSYSVSESATCEYLLNGAGPFPAQSGIILEAIDGYNVLNLSCTDASNNVGVAGRVFSVNMDEPEPIENLTGYYEFMGDWYDNHLNWEASASDDVTQYRVYRDVQPITDLGGMSPIGSTSFTVTQYTDSLRSGDTTYYYAVTPLDVAGHENMDVEVIQIVTPDTLAPPNIVGLSVSAVENEPSLSLTWTKTTADDAVSYRVYRSSTDFDSIYASGVTLRQEINDTNTNSFIDENLGEGVTFFYAVTAVDEQNNENPSVNAKSGTTIESVPPVITITQPISGSFHTEQPLTLAWNVDENVDSCRYSLNSEPMVALPLSGTNLSYTASITTGQGEHSLVVECTDESSNVGTSAPTLFAVDSVAPDKVTFTVTDVEHTSSLVLNWTPSDASDFARYNIYRSLSYFGSAGDTVFHTTVNESTVTVLIEDGLTPGETYYYAVAPVDVNNNVDLNVQSKSATVFDNDSHRPSTPLVLNPNGGLVEPPNDESLLVTWTQSFDPDGDSVVYDVSYTTNTSDFTPPTLIEAGVTGTTVLWNVTEVEGGEYYVCVQANDGILYSVRDCSDEPFTLTHEYNEPPTAISGVTVIGESTELPLTISWDQSDASDFEQYNVYRSTQSFYDVAGMQPLHTISEINNTEFVDSQVAEFTEYHYGVTAVDDRGQENTSVITGFGVSGDVTPPTADFTSYVPAFTYGVLNMSAEVTDGQSGLGACEICVSADALCDWELIEEDYVRGDAQGGCEYEWQSGDSSTGDFQIQFRITDQAGNTAYSNAKNTTVVDQESSLGYMLTLYPGWNLVSLPIIPEDTRLEKVLEGIEGSYDKVYFYDSNTKLWYIHKPERGFFDPENTLLELEPSKGYWIKMREFAELEVRGYALPQYQISLFEGWNYVGYPSVEITLIEKGFGPVMDQINVLYEYVSEEQRYVRYEPYASYNSISHINPGKGYAVEMVADGELIVTP